MWTNVSDLLFVVTLIFSISLCWTASIDQVIQDAENKEAMDQMARDSNVKLIELDMMFTMEDWDFIQTVLSTGDMVHRKKRKALSYESRRWPNKEVPYTIDSSFSSGDRNVVNQAIAEWEYYTCLNFRPAGSGDSDKVSIENGGGCASYIGKIGGSQLLWLAPGCRYKGIVVHELGHAIGFFHEQSRPDRDNFVTILYQNIQSGRENNFEKYTRDIINTYGVQYDYTSVMHYGERYFSKNGERTIVTKDPSKQSVIGNRNGLTFRDIHIANLMYKCSESCKNPPSCPANGFLGKDCKCWCPGDQVPAQHCPGEVTPKPTDPSSTSSTPSINSTPSPQSSSSTTGPTPTQPSEVLLRSGDWCFAAFEDKKDQISAEDSCNRWRMGGHLAWFTDENEWSALATALTPKSNIKTWFIGLEEADFYWVSHTKVTYTNFYRNEPNRDYEECVVAVRNYQYQWADTSCRSKTASLCKVQCTSGSCTDCSFQYNGFCFKIVNTRLNQVDAEANCARWQDGSHLAWFDTAEEHQYAATQLKSAAAYLGTVYIGMMVKSRLMYTSGAKVTFIKWGTRQPNGNNELCGVLERDQVPKYGWGDTKCRNTEAYICKAPCAQTAEDICDTLSGSGPHSTICLRKWWLDTGCSIDGSGLTSKRDEYNSMTVNKVKVTMFNIRQSALSGNTRDIDYCYGPNNVPTNGCDSSSNGPHTTTCLLKWWLMAGCSPKGTSSPTRADQSQRNVWNRKNAASILTDMRVLRSNAFQNKQGYSDKCYGEKYAVDCGTENSMGPHQISCLMRWWYEAGCAPSGSSSPINQPSFMDWDQMAVSQIKADMYKYRVYAMNSKKDSQGEAYVTKCYGEAAFAVCTCDSLSGPHNISCQMKWWLDTGCSPKGTLSPAKIAMNNMWRHQTVDEVKKDMASYRDKAFQADPQAVQQCYGEQLETGENCLNRYAKGPHKMTCLMKWWITAKCRPNAAGSPMHADGKRNLPYWNARRANQVQNAMKTYPYYAFRGNSKDGVSYIRLCYGI